MEILETVLHSFVNLAMLLFEYIGVAVITFSGIQGMVNYVRKAPDTRLMLAKGLAMGLEFKLGSEILRTVIVRNLNEIYIVAGIIALRAILTILIHWEIKNEETEKKVHAETAAALDTAADAAVAAAVPQAAVPDTAVHAAATAAIPQAAVPDTAVHAAAVAAVPQAAAAAVPDTAVHTAVTAADAASAAADAQH